MRDTQHLPLFQTFPFELLIIVLLGIYFTTRFSQRNQIDSDLVPLKIVKFLSSMHYFLILL